MAQGRTLGVKLTFGGILIVLIPVLAIGGFSLFMASNAMEDLSKGQAAQIAKDLANVVDAAMKGELKIASGIAGRIVVTETAAKVSREGPEAAAQQAERVSAELAKITKGAGADYEVIVVTDAKGNIFSDSWGGKLKGAQVGDSDYVKESKSGQATFGAVSKSKFTGKPVAPIGAPIYKEGEYVGSVGLVLNAALLGEKIGQVKMGKTGYAWMIDKTGVFIYHPKSEFILEMNIKDLDGMKEVAARMTTGQASVENYVFQGFKKIAGFAPIKSATWSVAFTQNEDEFLESVHAIRNFVVVIGLVLLALTIASVTYFARTISNPIRNAVREMSEAAQQVTGASGQVTSSSQSLAEGTSEQASALEESSASLEEMASMTKQNAANAGQADGLMKQANTVIENARETMDSLTRSMTDITTASAETSKIVKTIDEIAFQTNLLALNAAVEAARAGDAGAGFAVVADEVRNLAIRAAEAAKNTASLIEGTVHKIQEGSGLVGRTNEAFARVSESASKVGELVCEIAAASQEQSHGIDQINRAVVEMDKLTQSNAANAEESASAAEEMSAQAEQLKQISLNLASVVGSSREEKGSAVSVVSRMRRSVSRKNAGPELIAFGTEANQIQSGSNLLK